MVDGLSARKTFVRQAFALSLGHLKLRRAVVPLLHLLGSEESEVWREVARVLGSFGTAAFLTGTFGMVAVAEAVRQITSDAPLP